MTAPAKSKGIDVASFQHPGGKAIDWHAVAKAGYTFAMVKATQGIDYTNPYLKEDFEGAHSAGLMCGAYHFYEAGIDGAQQAEYFIHSLVQRITDLGVWLDWEPAALPDWEVTTAYNAFIAECEKTRRPCGVYMDGSWHETFVRLNLNIHRLWFADPTGKPVPAGTMVEQLAPETVPGVAAACDVDSLLNIRGLNITSPPKAAEVPFVHEPEHVARQVDDAHEPAHPGPVPAVVPEQAG